MKRTPDFLRESAGIYEERNAVYGDTYKHHGTAMAGLFPNGLALHSKDDFNRFGIVNMMVSKLAQ